MAGKNGFCMIVTRQFESLESLKKFLNTHGGYGKVQEILFNHTVATGAAGASIEIEEKTGTTITRKTSAAQVYCRYHTNDNAYDVATVTMKYLTITGVIKAPTAVAIDTTDSTTEVAIGGTDFFRPRPYYPICTVTPASGHTMIITDADCGNVDGSSNDIFAMVEENNYNSIHSRYFVPLEDENGKGMLAYLAKIECEYQMAVSDEAAITPQYAILTVTCTPYGEHETTFQIKCKSGVKMTWEIPFRLAAATDVIFTVADDTLDGGNFTLDYDIVEATAL